MANITFTSPSMSRDKTVYAVAGHNGTLLAVAQKEGIKIPFDCQDGECGSCVCEVKLLEPGKQQKAHHLTDKEKEILVSLGKISKAEIEAAEVGDIPPKYRLACQFIVRDEDILVSFSGESGVTL
ncbi:ferredoxin [Magnetococcus marinus MC-1]|uniref:Ferredoxin n=1 Tax=Magnetococcus marinus (strain ATCC BAA-1437 / JCM 17883 / MC-1) TaxID=156889 RepID=A0L6V6_MAGMM|nr:2Fe-2S iron-sulfur cluster-binding protein [Magnetococcus marinus]ABK43699.1 ferredoxin [Magnetococcus marinus MC-1]